MPRHQIDTRHCTCGQPHLVQTYRTSRHTPRLMARRHSRRGYRLGRRAAIGATELFSRRQCCRLKASANVPNARHHLRVLAHKPRPACLSSSPRSISISPTSYQVDRRSSPAPALSRNARARRHNPRRRRGRHCHGSHAQVAAGLRRF